MGWALDFASLLFWVGVGLAGTLVSTGLLLLGQRSLASTRRAAEAMAVCALVCAACSTAFHFGRPWLLYWLAPAPNQMGTWPQLRSPLVWGMLAVGACGTVTVLLSYLGLLPDLATLRDRSRGSRRKLFGVLAMGWRGSLRHWHHYEEARRILVGSAAASSLAALLIVSTNLVVTQIPGWHGVFVAPRFVAEAVLSALASIVALLMVARRVLGFEHVITVAQLSRLVQPLLVASLVVGFARALELLVAWSSGDLYARSAVVDRAFGPFGWAFWAAVAGSVIAPQLLWLAKIRASPSGLFTLAVLADVGVWLGRFGDLVAPLHRDLLPATWQRYQPTWWDAATLLGSCGLFLALFCLYVRFLPVVAGAEAKAALVRGEETR